MNQPELKVTGRVLTLSASTLARNPNLGASDAEPHPPCTGGSIARPPSRIRQSSKPISNVLETEFGILLRTRRPLATIWEKGLCFRLANGCVYWPDWACFGGGVLECHEVKGKKAWDDSIVKLKVAAATYPQFEWYLQDKPDGQWREYRVLP